MHSFDWWTIPLMVEGAIICTVIIVAILRDRFEAVSFGIVGSLTCAFLALGCYTFAG